ncbi:hypothetical protein TSUD_214590 [Trifolium subterraneum]|uniref:Mitoferrin n=1 Tax=Trifolium subterraneum TaxID=3900 RepID=A0A2Z6MMX0_TRISU|nr:hypothetical protein TSUD_214590 [Trifolium subterraneum]
MATEARAKFQNPDFRPDFQTLTPSTDDGLHSWQLMIAGSIAGCVEHMAMFPVDTVKTHMQAITSCPIQSVSIRQAFNSILQSEGPSAFYRGIGAMGLGAGPAHAVHFLVIETCKKRFSQWNLNKDVASAASGVCAAVASDAVFTPMDMVKQRLQLSNSGYKGVFDCVKRVMSEEGFGAFYASYRTTVLMNAPFYAVHVAAYDAAKRGLNEVSSESVDDERLIIHATAGAAAGGLAAAVTTPLDVVKTQLQCQLTRPIAVLSQQCGANAGRYGDARCVAYHFRGCHRCIIEEQHGTHCCRCGVAARWTYLKEQYSLQDGVCGCDRFKSGSIGDVIKTIVKKDGYRGLMRGWVPRMLFHAPAAAISWSTYEAGKSFFQDYNEQKDTGTIT